MTGFEIKLEQVVDQWIKRHFILNDPVHRANITSLFRAPESNTKEEILR